MPPTLVPFQVVFLNVRHRRQPVILLRAQPRSELLLTLDLAQIPPLPLALGSMAEPMIPSSQVTRAISTMVPLLGSLLSPTSSAVNFHRLAKLVLLLSVLVQLHHPLLLLLVARQPLTHLTLLSESQLPALRLPALLPLALQLLVPRLRLLSLLMLLNNYEEDVSMHKIT